MDDNIFNDISEGMREFISHKRHHTPIKKESVCVEVPDVKGLRESLDMTQTVFSDTFGFSIDTVKAWEQKKRVPGKSSRYLLLLIAANPDFVLETIRR